MRSRPLIYARDVFFRIMFYRARGRRMVLLKWKAESLNSDDLWLMNLYVCSLCSVAAFVGCSLPFERHQQISVVELKNALNEVTIPLNGIDFNFGIDSQFPIPQNRRIDSFWNRFPALPHSTRESPPTAVHTHVLTKDSCTHLVTHTSNITQLKGLLLEMLSAVQILHFHTVFQ